MISADQVERIPEPDLEEMWFAFQHRLLGELQSMARKLKGKGITQEHIAARIGAQPAQVSKWLKGRNMTTKTMHKLARGMDCRPEVTLHPLSTLTASNTASYSNPFHSPAPGLPVPPVAGSAGTSISINVATT